MIDQLGGFFADAEDDFIKPQFEDINGVRYLVLDRYIWRHTPNDDASPIVVIFKVVPVELEANSKGWTEIKPRYFIRVAKMEAQWRASKEELEQVLRSVNGNMQQVLEAIKQKMEKEQRSSASMPQMHRDGIPEA